MSAERPAKRIRQACEPCRRKKSRCPGEKPICSHCARLQQNCFYADERNDNGRSSATPTPQGRPSSSSNFDGRLEDRLKYVESQLLEVLANQSSTSRGASLQVAESPRMVNHPQPSPRPSTSTLPHRDVIINAAETYLRYCDCQPLPLFQRSTFLRTLKDRKPEVIFSLLALTLRYIENSHSAEMQVRLINSYVEAARSIISKKVFEGTVELSTIQSLCLLTLVYFADGHTRKASVQSSLAMSLAHNAGLASESNLILPDQEKEERRRCFWSLFLLKRLHGADFMILDFAAEDNFPWYPQTTGEPPTPGEQPNRNEVDGQGPDKGIVAYAIQLSEVWFKITRYARRRGKPSSLPPWSSQSEYTTILAHQMDFETRMPFKHRFEPAKFSQRSVEHLNSNRDYWGPWLFIQFLYHTNLCLLNHPLLLSLRLRNFKCVIPEIFLQHTSDLILSHASWIINFIDMLEAKPFRVTDPFLGHCVAIIATIYLQESLADDPGTRREKQDNFDKCLKFILGFGQQWPHLERIASKLQNLAETVSSTYVASEESTRQNRKLLIDLGQFFEILEYSSSSEVPDSARDLFGPSLQSSFAGFRTEMAQTSVLPQPTRVERQEFGNLTPNMMHLADPLENTNVMAGTSGTAGAVPIVYSEDELAVLAESFFHQRNEFGGDANWWNSFGLEGA